MKTLERIYWDYWVNSLKERFYKLEKPERPPLWMLHTLLALLHTFVMLQTCSRGIQWEWIVPKWNRCLFPRTVCVVLAPEFKTGLWSGMKRRLLYW